MATGLDPEIIRQIIASQQAPQTQFDPTAISQGAIRGMDLAATIEGRKNSQEDRARDLRDRIAKLKAAREQETRVQAFRDTPSLGTAEPAFPEEAAKERIKAAFDQKSKNERPDNIKQLFQLADGTTVGVTYGGDMKTIQVPGQGKLNPLTKALPAEQLEKTGTFEAMNDLVSRIRQDITDPKTGMISEEGKGLIGPLDVPTNKVAAFTPKADPAATSFYQKVQDLKNQIIYLRSGKQINEEEYKRLRASLPSEYRDESVFLSDLANFERTFQDVATKRNQAFTEGGYKVPAMGNPAPAAGNPGQKTGFRVISVRPSGGQ